MLYNRVFSLSESRIKNVVLSPPSTVCNILARLFNEQNREIQKLKYICHTTYCTECICLSNTACHCLINKILLFIEDKKKYN